MNDTHPKTDTSHQHRDLGVAGAFSIGIGGIVGGGIFATLGLAGSQARGATYLSFIVGGLVALLTAYSYVRLSLTYPGEGGTVTFLNRAFGSGRFAGGLNTLLVLSYIIIMALYAGAFANYAGGLLPAFARDIGQQALAPGIILLLAFVNLVGPKLVEKSERLFNVGKLSTLLVFIIAGLMSPALTLERLGPSSWAPPVEIVGSGMLVFLSYEGFELIANASNRIRNPARTLPFAYYGSILAAMVLYVLIVVVAIGHLTFEALAAASDRSVAAAAETFLGGFGAALLSVGAILATASAINADLYGASKLPTVLAGERQMPKRYAREIWGRHPAALILIATGALLIARFVDLHAISASASAGFLLVFAMVNVGNAKLARQTGSRRWVSVLAAAACLGALGVMIVQILGQPEHAHAVWLIIGVAVVPFVYEFLYSAIAGRKKAIEQKTASKRCILILGGGFAGAYTAFHLEKRLGGAPDVEVALVSGENFVLFTPMLHEVAGGDVAVTDIVQPLRKMLRRTRVAIAEVEAIDLAKKQVRIRYDGLARTYIINYDQLVLALGTVTNFYQTPGLAEHALTMKTLGDAILVRNRVIDALELADNQSDETKRKTTLTVVVAGGGFAGVETAGAVNDFLREAARFYHHLKEDMIRVVVVDPGDHILPELGASLGHYARKQLGWRGVEIRLKTKVTGYDGREVTLDDGTKIATRMLIWTAGITPPPLLSHLPCARQRGRVVANEFLQVPDWPGVWALGDCALVPDAYHPGKFYPPTAQHATRQAAVLASNIVAALRGQAPQPFKFKIIGLLATIGRRTGVAEIFGVKFSGIIAWWLWRGIYLSKLPGLQKKIRVAIDWMLDFIFSKDIVQLPILRSPTISEAGESSTRSAPCMDAELVSVGRKEKRASTS